MSADIIFYIDKSKNPRQNPQLTINNASTDDSKLTFVAGDKVGIGIVFLTGTSIDTTMATGSNPKYLNLSIGTVGADAPTTSVTSWYLSGSWGYTGSLNLLPLTASFTANESYIEPTMQLQVTSSNATKQTVMLRKINVLNPVDVI